MAKSNIKNIFIKYKTIINIIFITTLICLLYIICLQILSKPMYYDKIDTNTFFVFKNLNNFI